MTMLQPTVQRTDELRLALVLNGGVSLAVWMGGVVFELNRLVRETHPVYRGLLELTATAARIDVISGTSAGGVNGAALALALLHDRGLHQLRDVWIKTGGLESLLHEPDDPDLRSLLRGDDYFLPNIRAAFEELVGDDPAPPELVPLSLSLTSTLLDGITHTGMDDFGSDIEDRIHRALWEFPHLPAKDAFTDKRIVDQLAFAARASASFPVAFEPALHKAQGKTFSDVERLVARTPSGTPLKGETYLMDGGILDNKPFDAALEAIAGLPAEGNTRRVLAYVVPDPAAAAEERKSAADGTKEPPTLAQAAWRSLVTIPGTQSIASHMAELKSHNDAMAGRWRRIVGAIVHMGRDGLLGTAALSFHAYRARRVDGMIQYFLERTEEHLSARKAEFREKSVLQEVPKGSGRKPDKQDGPPTTEAEAAVYGMRRATRQWLASGWRLTAQPVINASLDATVEEDGGLNWRTDLDGLSHEWAMRLPPAFDPTTLLLGPGHTWSWGIYALQFVAEFTTEILRRTQRLHSLTARWRKGNAGPKAEEVGPAIPTRMPGPVPEDSLENDRRRSQTRARLRAEKTRISDRSLQREWRSAYRLAENVRQLRREADKAVGAIGSEGFDALVLTWKKQEGEQPPLEDSLNLLGSLLQVGAERDERSSAYAFELCALLVRLRGPMKDILDVHRVGPGRVDIDEAVAELRAIYNYLFDPVGSDDEAWLAEPDVRDRVAWRVLALEVFEVTAGSRRRAPGVQAEVVQISARLQSAFGGSRDPSRKLNGMQLAHFGAFYKKSWRANDWTFGRLDGIDRAVRVALNPDALQKRYGYRYVKAGTGGEVLAASEYVWRYIRALAVDTVERSLEACLREWWDRDADAIREELAWLDVPATVPPPVLEHCARALTRRLQLEALMQELPQIATCLQIEEETGAPPSLIAGEPLLVKVAPAGVPEAPSPEVAIELVRDNLLGSETLALQLGTDQLTRTASQGLASAHTALSSKAGGLSSFSSLNVIFKVTEWPLRILYWLAVRLSSGSRTEAAVNGLALGVGAAIVAAGMMSEKMPGGVLSFGWALLAGTVAVTLLRSRVWGIGLVVCLLLAMFWLNKLTFVLAGAIAVVVVLILQPWGGLVAMLLAIGLALWWSAGGSVDAAGLLWKEVLGHAQKVVPADWAAHRWIASLAESSVSAPGPAASTPAAAAAASAAAADYARLRSSLAPAGLLALLLVFVALGRHFNQRLATPRQMLLRKLRQVRGRLRSQR